MEKGIFFNLILMKKLLLLLFPLFVACQQPTQHRAEFWAHHFSFAKDISYGPEKKQLLDIFSQGQWIGEPHYWKADTQEHPTLIYIHGGGWMGGSKEGVIPFIIPYLERGFNVVLLDYRTGENTAPQAVDDCMLALSWIAEHHADFNIDPQQIYLSGESAGGHLALITGLLNAIPKSHLHYSGDRITIQAIINWFGITDIAGIDTFFSNQGEAQNYASLWVGDKLRMDSISAQYSPIHRISPHSPAVISIHGQKDSVVPFEQAAQLHTLLKQNKVREKLLAISDGKHLGFNNEAFQKIYSEIFSFIEAPSEH